MGWVLLQFYMTTPIWSVSHDDVLDWVAYPCGRPLISRILAILSDSAPQKPMLPAKSQLAKAATRIGDHRLDQGLQ